MVKWLDDLSDFYHEKYCKDGEAKKKFQQGDAEVNKDLEKIRKKYVKLLKKVLKKFKKCMKRHMLVV